MPGGRCPRVYGGTAGFQQFGRARGKRRAGGDDIVHQQDGAVGSIELATALIQRLSEKALGKRRALEKNRLVVSMSQGCTRVEQTALEDAVRCFAGREPVAASVLSDFELQLSASVKAVRTATRGQSESVRQNTPATSLLLI